jgi:hypothetical protein
MIVSHLFGSPEEIQESNSINDGAVGNRSENVREWDGREWIGEMGDTIYVARLLNGGIGLARSRSMSSLAILNTRDNGNFWSLESFLNLRY